MRPVLYLRVWDLAASGGEVTDYNSSLNCSFLHAVKATLTGKNTKNTTGLLQNQCFWACLKHGNATRQTLYKIIVHALFVQSLLMLYSGSTDT